MPGQQDECSPLRQPDHHSGQPRPTSRMDPAPPLFPSSFALHDRALALFLFDCGGIERAVALMSQLVLTANLYFLAKYREDASEAFFARRSFSPLDPCVSNGLAVILARLWCPWPGAPPQVFFCWEGRMPGAERSRVFVKTLYP